MFETVKRLYDTNKIDITGLDRAVKLKWITEEEKQEILNSKLS